MPDLKKSTTGAVGVLLAAGVVFAAPAAYAADDSSAPVQEPAAPDAQDPGVHVEKTWTSGNEEDGYAENSIVTIVLPPDADASESDSQPVDRDAPTSPPEGAPEPAEAPAVGGEALDPGVDQDPAPDQPQAVGEAHTRISEETISGNEEDGFVHDLSIVITLGPDAGDLGGPEGSALDGGAGADDGGGSGAGAVDASPSVDTGDGAAPGDGSDPGFDPRPQAGVVASDATHYTGGIGTRGAPHQYVRAGDAPALRYDRLPHGAAQRPGEGSVHTAVVDYVEGGADLFTDRWPGVRQVVDPSLFPDGTRFRVRDVVTDDGKLEPQDEESLAPGDVLDPEDSTYVEAISVVAAVLPDGSRVSIDPNTGGPGAPAPAASDRVAPTLDGAYLSHLTSDAWGGDVLVYRSEPTDDLRPGTMSMPDHDPVTGARIGGATYQEITVPRDSVFLDGVIDRTGNAPKDKFTVVATTFLGVDGASDTTVVWAYPADKQLAASRPAAMTAQERTGVPGAVALAPERAVTADASPAADIAPQAAPAADIAPQAAPAAGVASESSSQAAASGLSATDQPFAPVNVVPAAVDSAPATDELAVTGVDVGTPTVLGVIAAMVGAGTFALGRRRRAHSS